MPARRKVAEAVVSSEEKIARLLAFLAIKDLDDKTAQVVLLRNVGFQISEVASMLGLSENNVSVAIYRQRRRKRSRRKSAKT